MAPFPLALAAILLAATPQGLPARDGTGWSLARLDLDVYVLPDEGRIEIEGTLRLRLDAASSSGPTLGMNARRPVMRFLRVDAPPGASVELDARHPALPQARLVHLRFDELLKRGAEVELSFACASEGGSRQLVIDEEVGFASYVEGWYPVALPGPGESLSAKGSAVGVTRMHLPAGWHSVSNGRLVESGTDGFGTVEVWKVERPVARSFVVGPFRRIPHEVGEREVVVYRLTGTEEEAAREAEALARVLAVLESRFGPCPYPSYGIVEIPPDHGDFYASSEQGFVIADSSAFGYPDGNLALFGHELGHAWWGNLVGSAGPGDKLCSETLAQYGAILALEALEGEEAATGFLRFGRPGAPTMQHARGYFDILRAGDDRPLAELADARWDHTLSDAKGHWVYHMLRRRVGDEVFFAVLNGLVSEYTGRELTVQGMRDAFNTAAPDAELETFFAQWLDRSGAPVLDVDWRNAKDGVVSGTIFQAQAGEPYHLVLDVAVDSASGTRRHTVEVRGRETAFSLPAPDPTTDVRLDPDHRLLIWTPEYGARP